MKTKKIIALILSLTLILGITACADSQEEPIAESSVETSEQLETTVEETETVVETVIETEETIEETEVAVVREAIPYSIDGMSAQEIFDTIVTFADVSEDATYSTFADRFAVLPIEVPEDYPDSVAGGFRTWQFAYEPADGEELGDIIDIVSILDTDAVDESTDTIVGGRLSSMVYIADEETADELFTLLSDYMTSNYGAPVDYGQMYEYSNDCYISIDYNENVSSYVVNVAIEITT